MNDVSQPLYLQVYYCLLNAINSNTNLRVAPIKETVIARHLGVSREPVRRALEMLSDTDFLRPAGNQGFTLTSTNNKIQEQDAEPLPPVADIRSLLPNHLNRASVSSKLYPQVESDLIQQSISGKALIISAKLADHYGVSRTIAKDLLNRLKVNGIVGQTVTGKWLLPAFSEKSITDTNEIRLQLEPFALQLATDHVPTELVQRHIKLHKEAATLPPRGLTASHLSDLERSVHQTLLLHCGNNRLVELLRTCSVVQSFNAMFYERFGSEFSFIDEHIEVLEAVASSDARAASISLSHHISVSTANTIRRLDQYREAKVETRLPYTTDTHDHH